MSMLPADLLDSMQVEFVCRPASKRCVDVCVGGFSCKDELPASMFYAARTVILNPTVG